MARFTLLLTLVALALPSAALAASGDAARESALATERYYSSYGNPTPVVTAAPAVSTGHSGPSWAGAAALGAALVLLAGGLGAYGARTVRPRGLGA